MWIRFVNSVYMRALVTLSTEMQFLEIWSCFINTTKLYFQYNFEFIQHP
jgi:hypothetical protein